MSIVHSDVNYLRLKNYESFFGYKNKMDVSHTAKTPPMSTMYN